MDPLSRHVYQKELGDSGNSKRLSLCTSEEDYYKKCLKEGLNFSSSSKNPLESSSGGSFFDKCITDSSQNSSVSQVTSQLRSPPRSLLGDSDDNFFTLSSLGGSTQSYDFPRSPSDGNSKETTTSPGVSSQSLLESTDDISKPTISSLRVSSRTSRLSQSLLSSSEDNFSTASSLRVSSKNSQVSRSLSKQTSSSNKESETENPQAVTSQTDIIDRTTNFLGLNLEALNELKLNMLEYVNENIDADWELIGKLNSLFSSFTRDKTAANKEYTHVQRLLLLNELKFAINRINNRLYSLNESRKSLVDDIKIAYFNTLHNFFSMVDITFENIIKIEQHRISIDELKKCKYKTTKRLSTNILKIDAMITSLKKLPGYELFILNPIYERFNTSIEHLKLQIKIKLYFPFDFDLAKLMNIMFEQSFLRLSRHPGSKTHGSKRKRSLLEKGKQDLDQPKAKKQQLESTQPKKPQLKTKTDQTSLDQPQAKKQKLESTQPKHPQEKRKTDQTSLDQPQAKKQKLESTKPKQPQEERKTDQIPPDQLKAKKQNLGSTGQSQHQQMPKAAINVIQYEYQQKELQQQAQQKLALIRQTQQLMLQHPQQVQVQYPQPHLLTQQLQQIQQQQNIQIVPQVQQLSQQVMQQQAFIHQQQEQIRYQQELIQQQRMIINQNKYS